MKERKAMVQTRFLQLLPVRDGSTHLLAENFLGSGLAQLLHLSRNTLAVRRYPRIAVFHGVYYDHIL